MALDPDAHHDDKALRTSRRTPLYPLSHLGDDCGCAQLSGCYAQPSICMSAFQEFFESGLVIKIAIGLIMFEMVAVLWLRRKAGLIVVLGLIPGLCLMVALLIALQDGDWRIIAFWISASLPSHLIDLRLRLRN
jgi:hypothetical protein